MILLLHYDFPLNYPKERGFSWPSSGLNEMIMDFWRVDKAPSKKGDLSLFQIWKRTEA